MRLLSLPLLLLAAPLAAQQGPPPCAAPEYRQFDFWVGTWDVYNPRGVQVGTNRIDSILGACALEEHWDGTSGGKGYSFNIWDRSRNVWHQTWVAAGGGLLLLEGGLQNGAMVMEGQTVRPTGPVRNRITWTPISRDSVRQVWDTWSDSAQAWVTGFDGLYVRRH